MSFGTATLKAPAIRQRKVKRYDCGKYGKLTATEIAKQAGIKKATVYDRLKQGYAGSDLAEPTKALMTRSRGGLCRYPNVVIALRITRTYPDRIPTAAEIQKVAPMCKRSANNWRVAMREAMA